MREMPLSFRFWGSVPANSGLFPDQGAGLVRRVRGPVELVDRPKVDGHRVDLATVHGLDVVHVPGERGELVGVLPDGFVGGVEQMGAVLVDLDAGCRVAGGVGVAADVIAAVKDEDVAATVRHAFRDSEPE